MDIGIIGCVTARDPRPAYINQHIALVRLDSNVVDPRFVAYSLAAERTQRGFRAMTDTGAKAGMNLTAVQNLRVAFPSLEEQRAISGALTEVDQYLTALARVVEKKRELRAAALDNLIWGDGRLPGFDGTRRPTPFGQLAEPGRQRVDPRRDGEQPFCVELEHIEPAEGRLTGSGVARVTASNKSVFHPDDVLFGKLRSYLRKYWLATRSGVCSTEIWVLQSNREVVEPRFLFQLVKTDQLIRASATASGTHMPRSDWNSLREFVVMLPSLGEQRAIADVLESMDREVATLDEQLGKARGIKGGMTQALLSGGMAEQ